MISATTTKLGNVPNSNAKNSAPKGQERIQENPSCPPQENRKRTYTSVATIVPKSTIGPDRSREMTNGKASPVTNYMPEFHDWNFTPFITKNGLLCEAWPLLAKRAKLTIGPDRSREMTNGKASPVTNGMPCFSVGNLKPVISKNSRGPLLCKSRPRSNKYRRGRALSVRRPGDRKTKRPIGKDDLNKALMNARPFFERTSPASYNMFSNFPKTGLRKSPRAPLQHLKNGPAKGASSFSKAKEVATASIALNSKEEDLDKENRPRLNVVWDPNRSLFGSTKPPHKTESTLIALHSRNHSSPIASGCLGNLRPFWTPQSTNQAKTSPFAQQQKEDDSLLMDNFRDVPSIASKMFFGSNDGILTRDKILSTGRELNRENFSPPVSDTNEGVKDFDRAVPTQVFNLKIPLQTVKKLVIADKSLIINHRNISLEDMMKFEMGLKGEALWYLEKTIVMKESVKDKKAIATKFVWPRDFSKIRNLKYRSHSVWTNFGVTKSNRQKKSTIDRSTVISWNKIGDMLKVRWNKFTKNELTVILWKAIAEMLRVRCLFCSWGQNAKAYARRARKSIPTKDLVNNLFCCFFGMVLFGITSGYCRLFVIILFGIISGYIYFIGMLLIGIISGYTRLT